MLNYIPLCMCPLYVSSLEAGSVSYASLYFPIIRVCAH